VLPSIVLVWHLCYWFAKQFVMIQLWYVFLIALNLFYLKLLLSPHNHTAFPKPSTCNLPLFIKPFHYVCGYQSLFPS
jgi:hypothetical protein